MGLEPIEHLVLDVGRDAGAVIGDGEYHGILEPLRRERNGLPARRKAYCICQEVEQGLAYAALIRHETADVRRGTDVELDAALDQPVLHAFCGGVHGLANIDGAEIELHGAGVDGGKVQDVIDDRQQRIGRHLDIAQIFALPIGQRPGHRIAEEMREADDIGQR